MEKIDTKNLFTFKSIVKEFIVEELHWKLYKSVRFVIFF